MFPKNEGTLDRDLRLAIGLLLMIPAIFLLKGILQVIVAILAVVLLVTAAIGVCPLYMVLRIRTNKDETYDRHTSH